ncbi:copper amine oxidase N-terminal domain-containing protein [Paenibacillus sp. SN-8-1]|uniref:copper amine oxidase N-terminal domain-containing protein n=1 Tax=Paenibacillus sp. SN-8-1 TaxID=3435409 RepID=UPI003D9A42F5
MFKKILMSVMVSSVVFSSAGAVSAATLPPVHTPALTIDVVVDGKKVSFPDTEPFFDKNGNTMVPLRFVTEKLGAEVSWNNATRTATLKYKGKTIVMTINSKVVKVDGQAVTLNTSAIQVEGRTMVPLRFVSETLQSDVKWDQQSYAVNIVSPEYQAKIDAGDVKLTWWGRELRANQNSNEWLLLSDTPDWAYAVKKYQILAGGNTFKNKEEVNNRTWDKSNLDRISMNIKNYYKLALNVDYRTIDLNSYGKESWKQLGAWKGYNPEVYRDFVTFVKKNKLIVEGYASPDPSSVHYNVGVQFIRTKFKFRVISANDASQFSMDSYDPSYASESPKFVKKGVWYEGYADISLFANVTDNQWEFYKVYSPENMFRKGAYSYKELK